MRLSVVWFIMRGNQFLKLQMLKTCVKIPPKNRLLWIIAITINNFIMKCIFVILQFFHDIFNIGIKLVILPSSCLE